MKVKARLCFYLKLRSYEYNVHVESLLSANVYLVTLLSTDQCSPTTRFNYIYKQNILFQNTIDWQ